MAFTQNANVDQFLQVIANSEGLTSEDISDYVINNNHTSTRSELSHYYLLQRYTQIEIYETQSSIHVSPDGKIFRYNNAFINEVAQKVAVNSPTLSHNEALQSVIDFFGYDGSQFPIEISVNEGREQATVFSGGSISLDDIPIKLMYYQRDNEELHLCYDITINEVDFSDWWSLKVDATTGEIVDQVNWTVECNFEHDSNGKHVCVDDHTCSEFTNNDNTNNNKSAAVMPNSYNVYPPPVESPNHGSRSIDTDPADLTASPFGWHDTNGVAGAEFTTTRGNNVRAQEDENGNNGTGFSPDGGTNLEFDFAIDFTSAPTVSREASLTNLFYWNNIIHDVWYQYGFDEASGNFQENNYGNGGFGSDSVNADGLDGSGTNNANFSTPTDGGNPRMQMFLWSAGSLTTTDINSPTSISGAINGVAANFGSSNFDETEDIILVDDGTANPTLGCNAFINATDVSGKIALIDRGTCEFGEKVLNAQDAGAIAAIICQNSSAAPFAMGPGAVGNQVTIPSIMISMADCNTITTNLPGVNLTMEAVNNNVQIDGSFDNVIIGHEYGHGISIRLTGGASNSNCLNTNEQMGEGWSDWIGLMMTIEATDIGETGRGIGTYATSQSTAGVGIRDFPYSTDLAVDPRSYNDIMTASIPHGVGSVWCAMLWEMTWILIDEYGFDSDLYNGTGGNNIAMELVTEGLKLQPCSPGFIDGRDAILAADLALNGGQNECFIWEAFAKRGLGINATQGSSNSRSDGSEDFTIPASCITMSTGVVLTEKTVDKTSVIAGDTLTYTLTFDNQTSIAYTNLIISDTLESGLNYVPGSATNGATFNNGIVSLSGINVASSSITSFSFQVVVDPTISSLSQSFLDEVENGNTDWVLANSNTGQDGWVIDSTNPFQGANNWFAENTNTLNIKELTLKTSSKITSTSELRFWHTYRIFPNFDGARVEISVDNQITWIDLETAFTLNGYNSSFVNDGVTLQAFGGTSGQQYIETVADLSPYAGENIFVKFTMFHLGNPSGTGWNIDNIEISNTEKTAQNIASFAANPSFDRMESIYPPTDIILGTCSDGIQNGTETGIDVGGGCSPASTCDFDLVINANPAAGGTFQVQNQITSSVNITSNTEYFASCILLENDFEVAIGTEFLAEINACTPFSDDGDLALKVVSTGSDGKNQTTVIDVNIPTAGSYTLQLTQEDGKTIYLPNQEFEKGVHRINVETEDSFIPNKIDVVKE